MIKKHIHTLPITRYYQHKKIVDPNKLLTNIRFKQTHGHSADNINFPAMAQQPPLIYPGINFFLKQPARFLQLQKHHLLRRRNGNKTLKKSSKQCILLSPVILNTTRDVLLIRRECQMRQSQVQCQFIMYNTTHTRSTHV